MRTTRDYLVDMQTYIARIEATTKDGRDAFDKSFVIQDAVIRQYEVLGEIVKRLPDDLLVTQSDVNWRAIKGFRDFLAHNYNRVDLDIVWGAVEQLPALRTAVAAMLKSLSDDTNDETET